MVKRFPAHYVTLEEFAIGYGLTWSFCWAVAAALAELGWWEEEEEVAAASASSEHHLHGAGGEQQFWELKQTKTKKKGEKGRL